MARRGLGGGMTALRAALGAVAGGLEGAQQAEALRRKQKLEEENAAFSRASVLSSLGLRPTMVRDTEDPAARNVVSLEQPSFAPRGSSPALASALQQGMGVDPSARSLSKPTTMSTANPLTTALDTATTRMKGFERQQSSLPANPAMQMQLPGVGRIGFRGPETEEEKAQQELAKFEGQQGVLEKREQGKFDRENRGYFDVLQKAGEIPSDATFEMYRNIPLKPAFDEYKQQVSMAGAMDRAKLMAGSQSRMGSYVTGTPEGAETPQILFGTRGGQLTPTGVQAPTKDDNSGRGEMASGLQAMGVARASSSLNLLKTNTQLMDKFEQKVLDGKAKITATQLELARKALSGQTGSAYAENALAKGIPMVMDKNPELLRYVRAAKGISGAVREITPRGGSNLFMQMEQTLAGIGPAGTDPESINQVRIFRNDILAGVQEGVNAMKGVKSGGTEPPASPTVDAARYASDPAYKAWVDSNRKR